ncbi:MAG TPA: nucleotide pyrophosphohydrolase [Candidatus Saccharimonadales bacterium]|jgi:NTP pyrophosphatase (non-canonical NTP hydrolase)|nr:nucleotide pyrophosphohydrolase [Candidatus Saccharimonadales bacterium]
MSNTGAPLSLTDLQKIIRKFCDDRDWDQFHNPKDLSISMMLEAAEVLEHFQWKNLEEMTVYSKEHKADIAEEIADVFYWVLLLSNKLDIDLVEAFQKKMAKNEQKYPVSKAKGTHKKYTELGAE